jgi:hypothetical protein
MKNQNTIFITIVSALAFTLAPIVQAVPSPDGGPTRRQSNDGPSPDGGPTYLSSTARANANSVDESLSVITVHSTDNVTRGKTGSFVLVRGLGKADEADMSSAFAGTYVNFKISGTAIAGVDYVLLVSPAYIGGSGYGLIQVKTLPDVRGSAFGQALSVIVTLVPGAGYAIGAASSATMWIKPALQSSNPSSN